MSVQSWLNEYYTEEARLVSRRDAPSHTILKWTGALPENLERHKVNLHDAVIEDVDGEYFNFNTSTCAYCWCYLNVECICDLCPLAKVRNGYSCIRARPEEDLSPFAFFVEYDDPRPMIEWLKKAKEYAEGRL